MLRNRWLHGSLARKISLLFGTAVLTVIIVTLWSPWLQMTALNWQTLLVEAKRVSAAAYQAVDLREPDWEPARVALTQQWPGLARALDLPSTPPVLVALGPHPPSGFRHEAMERLSDAPHQRYFWKLQDRQRVFRFAMAIRGTDAEPHPGALRGIIDVKLPVPEDRGMWNSIVTVLAGASGAVLAILVFYVVTQRLVLSPVHTLRRAAERVATGDIHARSSITTGDEFQKLSTTFNEMLTHLQAAQEEQRRINRSLDIKLGELAETNVGLYESNRLKSEFLANVTHELRTPLVSIIGFAELLRDAWEAANPDRERLAHYSENIRSSGRSLLDIINDLLDLTKLEAGKMELHLSDFSLLDLCKDLIDFVRPLADKRDQTLTLAIQAEPPPFHSDSGKVKQVLYNLLSNAVKFTPRGGAITLHVDRVGDDAARLAVQDTGPGIPKAEQKAVFEKFRQLDASETREHAGTGLGLAITRELVRALGGTIGLQSEPGKGATFTVVLPTRPKRDVHEPTICLT